MGGDIRIDIPESRYEFQCPPGMTDLQMERILVTELYCISSCSWNSTWRAHAFRTALLRRPAKSKQCVAATVMVMCAFCSYTVQNRSLLVDGIAIMVWLRLNWNFYSAPSFYYTIMLPCHIRHYYAFSSLSLFPPLLLPPYDAIVSVVGRGSGVLANRDGGWKWSSLVAGIPPFISERGWGAIWNRGRGQGRPEKPRGVGLKRWCKSRNHAALGMNSSLASLVAFP